MSATLNALSEPTATERNVSECANLHFKNNIALLDILPQVAKHAPELIKRIAYDEHYKTRLTLALRLDSDIIKACPEVMLYLARAGDADIRKAVARHVNAQTINYCPEVLPILHKCQKASEVLRPRMEAMYKEIPPLLRAWIALEREDMVYMPRRKKMKNKWIYGPE